MTTKEKAGYDFDMMLGNTIVFLTCNFKDLDGTPRAMNVPFKWDDFWNEAKKGYIGRTTDWSWYDRPIVAVWKTKGKGLPLVNIGAY